MLASVCILVVSVGVRGHMYVGEHICVCVFVCRSVCLCVCGSVLSGQSIFLPACHNWDDGCW